MVGKTSSINWAKFSGAKLSYNQLKVRAVNRSFLGTISVLHQNSQNAIVYDHDEQLLTELLCTAETSELKWSTGVPINHSLPAKLLLQKTGARIVVRDKPLRQPFSGKRLNQTCTSAKLNNQMTNIAIGTKDPMVEYSKLIECFCSINNLCSNFEVKFYHQTNKQF